MSCSTWPGASHSTAGGWWAAKPPGCGARPIQSISTSPTPPGTARSSSRHRSRLARSRSTQRLRVAPLMRLRDQQAGSPAGRPGAQMAGLDQQHRAEARPRGRPRRWRRRRCPPPTTSTSGRGSGMLPSPRRRVARSVVGELITPDGAQSWSDPIRTVRRPAAHRQIRRRGQLPVRAARARPADGVSEMLPGRWHGPVRAGLAEPAWTLSAEPRHVGWWRLRRRTP